MGTNTGVTEFAFASGIQGTMDQLQFRVATPIILNQALPWRLNINDPAQYTAFSIYLQSTNGSAVDRVLFPTSGSITVTASSETMGQKTTATVGMTSYAELDDAGAVLAGGCTVALSSLALNLAQGSATFQKPEADGGEDGRPWVKIIPIDKFGELVPTP